MIPTGPGCRADRRPAWAARDWRSVPLLAAGAVMFGGVALEAHVLGVDQPRGVSGWDVAVLAALACSAALHVAGSARLARHGGRQRTIERAAFWSGWACLVAAVAPPLDHAAAETFSMHMVQHELLMLIGAPLVVVGRPIVPWLWALGSRLRVPVGAVLRPRAAGGVWRALTRPFIAWAVYAATIWIWHLPALYDAALADEGVHALQHAMFVGAAVLFWWGIVYGRYGRAGYGAAALYVFATMVHTGVLGAMFALSSSPVVPHYEARAAAVAVDPLTDQQLAGLIMWIPSGVVLTVCGLALLLAWISEGDRRARIRSGS